MTTHLHNNLVYFYSTFLFSKYIFSLCLFLFCFVPIQIAKNKNTLYIEGLGVGGYGSLNFERSFLKKEIHQLNARVGFGTYNITDFTNTFNPDITLPFGVNYFLGKQHKLLTEFGFTFSSIVQLDPSTFLPKRSNNFSPYFGLGYRFNKEDSRLILGATYYRKFEFFEYPRHWAGFSIGILI